MKIEDAIKQPRFRDDIHKAIINLLYTSGWLASRQEEFLKTFGITPAQFNILRILRGQSGKSLTGQEIKSRMLERNSDISRLLDRLEGKDLIRRSPRREDRRASDITIAPKGLAILKEIDKKIVGAEKQVFSLSMKEARQLSNLLDKARGNS
jgi:DNA-binding MarR family transcriptional regulator